MQSNIQKAQRDATQLREDRNNQPKKRPVCSYYKNPGHVTKGFKKKKADTAAKLKAQRQATATTANTILKNSNDPSSSRAIATANLATSLKIVARKRPMKQRNMALMALLAASGNPYSLKRARGGMILHP